MAFSSEKKTEFTSRSRIHKCDESCHLLSPHNYPEYFSQSVNLICCCVKSGNCTYCVFAAFDVDVRLVQRNYGESFPTSLGFSCVTSFFHKEMLLFCFLFLVELPQKQKQRGSALCASQPQLLLWTLLSVHMDTEELPEYTFTIKD